MVYKIHSNLTIFEYFLSDIIAFTWVLSRGKVNDFFHCQKVCLVHGDLLYVQKRSSWGLLLLLLLFSHIWLFRDNMNCRPPGSSVYGISQARLMGWVAISSSGGSSQPREWSCVSCLAGRFFTTEPPRKPFWWLYHQFISIDSSYHCVSVAYSYDFLKKYLECDFYHFTL